jgi:hypothetical protein
MPLSPRVFVLVWAFAALPLAVAAPGLAQTAAAGGPAASARHAAPAAGAPDAGAPEAGGADAGAGQAAPTTTAPDAGGADAGQTDAAAPADVEAELEAQRREEEARAAEEHARIEAEERAAEDAQRRALEHAEVASSAVDRLLAREHSDIEGVRAAQAEYRRDLARARTSLATTLRRRAERATALRRHAERAAPGSPEADAAYEDLVTELRALRGVIAAALDAYGEVPAAPRYTGELADIEVSGPELTAERERLAHLAASLEVAAPHLEAEAREIAWTDLDDTIAHTAELNDARIALVSRLSPAKRARVLGFGPEGIDQLRREIHHARLLAHWTTAAGERLVRARLAELTGRSALGALGTRALLLVGLLIAAFYAALRGRELLELLRSAPAPGVRVPLLRRLADLLVLVAQALIGELALLAAVLLLPAVLPIGGPDSASRPLYEALITYAVYRLALAAIHRGLARAAAGGDGSLSAPCSAKILRSIRVAGRYALAVALILLLSAAAVGEGALYHLVARFAWLGAFPIAALVLRWWHDEIADTYLHLRPTGTLAAAVERTRGRGVGLVLTAVAFAALTAGALVRAARRFVLGFEQTRKALAYLFRVRLERRAEAATAPAAALPSEIEALFTDTPADGEPYVLERFPGLDRLDAALQAWSSGDRVGSLLVVGPSGVGKTSWLRAAARRAGALPFTPLQLIERDTTAAGVLRTLGRFLGAPPEEAASPDALAGWLRAGERRIVALDDLHLWFLRGIGTLGGYRAFAAVVERAGDRIFWLATFNSEAYKFLRWIRRGEDLFRAVVHLPPWSESEIETLLRARTERAGRAVRYDALVAGPLDGGADEHRLSTARDYNRLIWDHAEGSPRVALDCWRRSLSLDAEGALHVRLFDRPDLSRLERLVERDKLVLCAVLWHERLTAGQAASSLGFPLAAGGGAPPPQGPQGVQEPAAPAAPAGASTSAHRVSTRFWPAVYRYLLRMHFIHT